MSTLKEEKDFPTTIIECYLPFGIHPPKPGAKRVFWLLRIEGVGLRWEHKGWLMPPTTGEAA